MRALTTAILLLITVTVATSQVYTHSTVGINGTYVGDCMTATCGGTYYDNGGAGGLYANSINSIYRVFCPSTPGTCMRATFTSIDMHNSNCIPGNVPCDVLTILNGATQNSTAIASITYANDGTNPVYTASNSSGCLGFRVSTSASNNAAGWAVTLSCVACAAAASQTANADCASFTPICSDGSFTSLSTGPGSTSESCTGCTAGGENYSNWYMLQISSSGTLGLTINPDLGNDDFDFALYGPGTACGSLGIPIRCSYSGAVNNTGMGNGASDNSEDVTGDGWVSTLAVTAGQTYFLMVNHWTPPTQGYLLTWNLSGGASLNCTILPVELLQLSSKSVANGNEITWAVGSELNNNYFNIERSGDGENFELLGTVDGQGTSGIQMDYLAMDQMPYPGINYYRLSQVDYDGTSRILGITSCKNENPVKLQHLQIYDLSGKMVHQENGSTISFQGNEDLAMLSDGVYILKMIDQHGRLVSRRYVRTADGIR